VCNFSEINMSNEWLINEIWFSNWQLGSYCYLCCTFWIHMLIQRNKSNWIKGKGNYKLEGSSNLSILFMWNNCWYGWRVTWFRRWLHFGTTFSRIGNSSSGIFFTILVYLHYLKSMSYIFYISSVDVFVSYQVFVSESMLYRIL
jgi:hypothetical protein